MKVSLRWLRDYVDIDLAPGDLAHRLTMAGLEVEAVETVAPEFSGVVVAKILSVRPHPGADRLSLCEVSTGETTLPVVCGAPNVKPGIAVALATVGAVLPGGCAIKSSRIRGELSEGMICAETELGIGDDASGILILGDDLPLGKDLKEALDLTDTVLDISITPNRADCLSMIGIAREIAALTGGAVRMPEVNVPETDEAASAVSSVAIEAPDLCPRYTARLIRGLTPAPSPAWMQRRLAAVGLRPISNIVDVTNFVMMEMGQPLHAFDFRFLEGGRIVVRRAQDGEAFTSLDGKERCLKGETLMICDAARPVAIAGIMGGENSEIKEDTTTVLLESAYFAPASIRRSARDLGMATDAAFRFERGVDPEGVVRALNRAAQLLAELGGGRVLGGVIDAHPNPVLPPASILLRASRVHSILGTEIPEEALIRILGSLEMTVHQEEPGRYRITPPSFRVDMEREIDLIEEIARIYGYDRIPLSMPSVAAMPPATDPRQALVAELKGALTGAGYGETVTFSFVPASFPAMLRLSADDAAANAVRIANPLSEEQGVLRTTLAYSLLETMGRNVRSGNDDLKLFEIAQVYSATHDTCQPRENAVLGILLSGARYSPSWQVMGQEADVYDLKGVVESLAAALKLPDVRFVADAGRPFLHPGRSCRVLVGSQEVGWLGEVHPTVQEQMDLRRRACLAELDVDALARIRAGRRIAFREISRYPASARDAAFIVSDGVSADRILDVVRERNEELLENVFIFDVYAGKNLPAGTRSLGFRFSYRASDRTLTDDEVSRAHGGLVKAVQDAVGASIRGETTA